MRILVACVVLASLTSCGYGEEQRVVHSFAEMEQVARTTGSEDDSTNRTLEIGEAEFQAVFREGDRVYFKVGENGPSDPFSSSGGLSNAVVLEDGDGLAEVAGLARTA
ncbi:hypothetical protein AB0F17_12940, partial [Nonomuraea sp. NPDC026600]|uniref:hypothetical protein n=1 Tax=Nonomuraea sp. NPDC026600 TaxID=3155363 RepID=UPI003407FFA0